MRSTVRTNTMTVTTQIIMISTVVKKVLRKHGDSDSTIFFVHEIVGDSFGPDWQIRIETVLSAFDFSYFSEIMASIHS